MSAASDPELLPGSGARWDVFEALPPHPREILDVGCGEGLAFAPYRQRGTRLVGIDFDATLLTVAKDHMDEVRRVDLERDAFPEDWLGHFDVIACCDVLEHLRDPWAALTRLRPLLSEDGVLVASIPNIRKWRMLAKLALGRWEYPEGMGTEQRDHVRFFTRKTIEAMLAEAGYGPATYFWPREAWHLRPSERTVDRITRGRLADFLYGSYTLAARPRREGAGDAL